MYPYPLHRNMKSSPEWDLVNSKIDEVQWLEHEMSTVNQTFIKCSLHLVRKPLFYTIYILLPTIAITSQYKKVCVVRTSVCTYLNLCRFVFVYLNLYRWEVLFALEYVEVAIWYLKTRYKGGKLNSIYILYVYCVRIFEVRAMLDLENRTPTYVVVARPLA